MLKCINRPLTEVNGLNEVFTQKAHRHDANGKFSATVMIILR